MTEFPALPPLGIVVVAFNSSDVILDCLESLLGSTGGVQLRVVVVDNASSDNTAQLVRDWATGQQPYTPGTGIPFALTPCPKPLTLDEVAPGEALGPEAPVTLVQAGVNGGFASGVNLGLAALASDKSIDNFWVVNPDGLVPPDAAAAFAKAAEARPGYALAGSRVCYAEPADQIQIDGGVINRWTGVTHNIHLGASDAATPPPDEADIDFIMGASMMASRAFYEKIGGMVEDYFLYYEEVDWAMRREEMPLIYVPGGRIYHHAGTAIGSPTLARFASPFSLYFKHRARMRFVRRFNPMGLPVAWAFGMAKAAQMLIRGAFPEAMTTLRAIHGLPPPAPVRARLSPQAAKLAFG